VNTRFITFIHKCGEKEELTNGRESHTRFGQSLKLYFSIFEIMPWEHKKFILSAKFQPRKVEVNS
jgi:hypothetical protein